MIYIMVSHLYLESKNQNNKSEKYRIEADINTQPEPFGALAELLSDGGKRYNLLRDDAAGCSIVR